MADVKMDFRGARDKFIPEFEKLVNREAVDGYEPNETEFKFMELFEALVRVIEVVDISEADIYETPLILMEARKREMAYSRELVRAESAIKYAEHQVDAHKKHIVAQAYRLGKVDGKNVETRKAQEATIIAADEILKEFEEYVRLACKTMAEVMEERDAARIMKLYWEEVLRVQLTLTQRGKHITLSSEPVNVMTDDEFDQLAYKIADTIRHQSDK